MTRNAPLTASLSRHFSGACAVDWGWLAGITKTATPQATESGQHRGPPDPMMRRKSQSQNRDARLTKIATRPASGFPAQMGLHKGVMRTNLGAMPSERLAHIDELDPVLTRPVTALVSVVFLSAVFIDGR